MVAVLLTLVFAAILVGALAVGGGLKGNATLAKIVLAGYALRLVLQLFVRNLNLFTSGGADSGFYEALGRTIAASWHLNGIHFVTADELPGIGATALPPNLFGLISYLTDGQNSRLAATGLVALAAGLTAQNIYTLAIEFGAERVNARLLTLLFYFQPAFLFYTSDTYKDGLVVAIVVGAIGAGLRVSRRFSPIHAVVGLLCLWALWYVRFYLIFVALAPLVVGLAGFGSKNLMRPVVATLAIIVAAIAVAAFTDVLQLAAERAAETFETATQQNTLEANAAGGSGVAFDDGGIAYNALPAKLAYTLFAPFFWAGGSIAFHIGKVDGFVWYFMMYRGVRAARQTDRRFVLMIATFIVPCTLMYAMSMSNVGLIVRQRLPIVAITAVLAAIYRPKLAPDGAPNPVQKDAATKRRLQRKIRTFPVRVAGGRASN